MRGAADGGSGDMGRTKKDRSYHPERSCGKWRYATRALAEKLRKKLTDQGEPMMVYGCTECGGFHLSSQWRRKRK